MLTLSHYTFPQYGNIKRYVMFHYEILNFYQDIFINTTELVLELIASELISFQIDKDSGDNFLKESPSSFPDRDQQEKTNKGTFHHNML